jgi:apolipoprotein N-acyltransferase
MQRSSIGIGAWKLWAAAGLSAGLLELPFPLAGPMPPWRSLFAWIGLAPLIWALLSPPAAEGPRPLRRAFLLSYVCGVLWYAGNCYWVRDVMMQYGDMPPLAPSLLLLGFSLVLGTYFGLFGLGLALVRKATGSLRLTLLFAPVLWTALDLAASRITSVPWDQLGYSQVDNGILNQIAPWTGVYGITFVLVLLNALVAGVVLKMQGKSARDRIRGYLLGALALLLIAAGVSGVQVASPRAPTTATAVLIQPNLNVAGVGMWPGGEWTEHMGGFAKLAGEQCKTYIAGIPETGAPQGEIVCPPYATHPDLIAWPESPAPYFEADTRLQQALTGFARANQAAMVVGTIGSDYVPESGWKEYNSALVMGADGARVGRYDKIHLVPFGEYVPFSRLLFFAHKLTGKVSKFDRGEARETFRLNGHRYGVFICYEAVFADEVRQFARMGAEVLVNISDDGWYGDTSAPWQHLNMARMRAIENRRWILRDTNNGVTAAIDPYGRVRQSIPRHVEDALPAEYGFRDDVTFYTEYGDVFAWVCALVSLGMAVWSGRRLLRQPVGLWKDRTDLADSESFIRNLRSENQPGRLKG